MVLKVAQRVAHQAKAVGLVANISLQSKIKSEAKSSQSGWGEFGLIRQKQVK